MTNSAWRAQSAGASHPAAPRWPEKWNLRVLALSQQDHLAFVLPGEALCSFPLSISSTHLPHIHSRPASTPLPTLCLARGASPPFTIRSLPSFQSPAFPDSPGPCLSPAPFWNLMQVPQGLAPELRVGLRPSCKFTLNLSCSEWCTQGSSHYLQLLLCQTAGTWKDLGLGIWRLGSCPTFAPGRLCNLGQVYFGGSVEMW